MNLVEINCRVREYAPESESQRKTLCLTGWLCDNKVELAIHDIDGKRLGLIIVNAHDLLHAVTSFVK